MFIVSFCVLEQLKTTTKKHHTTKNGKEKTETYGRALGLVGDGVLGVGVLGVGFGARLLGWVFGWVLAFAWFGVRLAWVFGCCFFWFLIYLYIYTYFSFSPKQETRNSKLKMMTRSSDTLLKTCSTFEIHFYTFEIMFSF